MALTARDYEFLATMLRDMAQYDERPIRNGDRVTCKVLREHMGNKILDYAQAQNNRFNITKFKELARL